MNRNRRQLKVRVVLPFVLFIFVGCIIAGGPLAFNAGYKPDLKSVWSKKTHNWIIHKAFQWIEANNLLPPGQLSERAMHYGVYFADHPGIGRLETITSENPKGEFFELINDWEYPPTGFETVDKSSCWSGYLYSKVYWSKDPNVHLCVKWANGGSHSATADALFHFDNSSPICLDGIGTFLGMSRTDDVFQRAGTGAKQYGLCLYNLARQFMPDRPGPKADGSIGAIGSHDFDPAFLMQGPRKRKPKKSVDFIHVPEPGRILMVGTCKSYLPETWLGGNPFVHDTKATENNTSGPTWPIWANSSPTMVNASAELPFYSQTASIYLGWALHMLADLAVPAHAVNRHGKGHQGYEDWVDKQLDTLKHLPVVPPQTGPVSYEYSDNPVWAYVQFLPQSRHLLYYDLAGLSPDYSFDVITSRSKQHYNTILKHQTERNRYKIVQSWYKIHEPNLWESWEEKYLALEAKSLAATEELLDMAIKETIRMILGISRPYATPWVRANLKSVNGRILLEWAIHPFAPPGTDGMMLEPLMPVETIGWDQVDLQDSQVLLKWANIAKSEQLEFRVTLVYAETEIVSGSSIVGEIDLAGFPHSISYMDRLRFEVRSAAGALVKEFTVPAGIRYDPLGLDVSVTSSINDDVDMKGWTQTIDLKSCPWSECNLFPGDALKPCDTRVNQVKALNYTLTYSVVGIRSSELVPPVTVEWEHEVIPTRCAVQPHGQPSPPSPGLCWPQDNIWPPCPDAAPTYTPLESGSDLILEVNPQGWSANVGVKATIRGSEGKKRVLKCKEYLPGHTTLTPILPDPGRMVDFFSYQERLAMLYEIIKPLLDVPEIPKPIPDPLNPRAVDDFSMYRNLLITILGDRFQVPARAPDRHPNSFTHEDSVRLVEFDRRSYALLQEMKNIDTTSVVGARTDQIAKLIDLVGEFQARNALQR